MRLSANYNRLNIAVTVAILLVAGVIYYFTISHILTNQVDKALVVEEHEVQDYVALNSRLPQVFKTNHQEIKFSALQRPIKRRFTDTVYRDLKDGELEPGRALHTQVRVSGQLYQVLVVQSKVETEDLIKAIFFITLGLIVALLTALFLLNRIILSHLWKPFYQVLQQVKAFSLAKNQSITPVPSTIDEFTELDEAFALMAHRVIDDYQTLKAFTENASHELMTPVAVISSKLDSYVQTGNFSDAQSKLLGDIYAAVGKLTRLNKAMLLLAKIENRLITDTQLLDIKQLVTDNLEQFDDLIARLELRPHASLQENSLQASLLLIEVLIGNLIGNAIRHNIPGGLLEIILNRHSLQVSNSGVPSPLDPKRIFNRFEKSASSEGTGLGLTLCKQICDVYGYSLSYSYVNHLHCFTVTFAHPK